jgi:hypothetical protein
MDSPTCDTRWRHAMVRQLAPSTGSGTATKHASWPQHIFHCAPGRPTAYYSIFSVLSTKTVSLDVSRPARITVSTAPTQQMPNRSCSGPQQIHEWSVGGTLVREIKVVFETMPERYRGGYYPWFLEHQYVLARTTPIPSPKTEWFMRG